MIIRLIKTDCLENDPIGVHWGLLGTAVKWLHHVEGQLCHHAKPLDGPLFIYTCSVLMDFPHFPPQKNVQTLKEVGSVHSEPEHVHNHSKIKGQGGMIETH